MRRVTAAGESKQVSHPSHRLASVFFQLFHSLPPLSPFHSPSISVRLFISFTSSFSFSPFRFSLVLLFSSVFLSSCQSNLPSRPTYFLLLFTTLLRNFYDSFYFHLHFPSLQFIQYSLIFYFHFFSIFTLSSFLSFHIYLSPGFLPSIACYSQAYFFVFHPFLTSLLPIIVSLLPLYIFAYSFPSFLPSPSNYSPSCFFFSSFGPFLSFPPFVLSLRPWCIIIHLFLSLLQSAFFLRPAYSSFTFSYSLLVFALSLPLRVISSTIF